MGSQIFKVKDNVLGTVTLVNASSKRKAEKLLESGRFEASKASPDEITKYVNDGGKVLEEAVEVAEAAPEAPPAEAPSAQEVEQSL